MGELGGMLASAVLKVVIQQLGAAMASQVMMQRGFSGDLEDMKMTLESVAAVLKDAERRSITEESPRLWLERLKSAAYDISQMIDELETDAKLPALKRAPFSSILKIGPKIKAANKMKMMREKLEKITKQHKDFSFMSDGCSNIHQVLTGDRMTSPKVDKAIIVGRTHEMQNILACLSSKILTQDFTIFSIYGMGGIGKTTLAQLVYNDKQFKDYTRVWVYVSQILDLNKINSSIVSKLSTREREITDLEMVIAGTKNFIILDDLWENDWAKLDTLKLLLNIGNGTKVIVIATTRDESIARRFSNIEPYKLKPLTDDMCWQIIKQKSAFEDRDDKELLEQIGREIAVKCGGVALAAQSLGYTLHSRRLDEWESIKHDDIWNQPTSLDSSLNPVLASLKLSYVSMLPCLKLCFGYCAIFPKGHKIVKDDLINQWISLGFIEPSNRYSLRQLGETYVTHLLGMSFLQYAESQSVATVHHDHEYRKSFGMHDLVHDLARSVMVSEIQDDNSKQQKNGGASWHYALLSERSKPSKSLRALHFMDCGVNIGLCDDALSSVKYLRVLDLSNCTIQMLPSSIGELKQLRYLSAPGVQVHWIPDCITKLSKLAYLNLSGSEILELPELIGDMIGLLHLDLSGCSELLRLPETFWNLKLLHLNLSNCSRVTISPGCVQSMTKLQYLNVSHCEGSPGDLLGHLSGLAQLKYLNLTCSSFTGGSAKADVLGTLTTTELEYLNLSSEKSYIRRLPEDMGTFVKLKYLNLSGWKALEIFPRSCENLKSLVHLNLSQCWRAQGIPEVLGSFKKLQYLNLSFCFRMIWKTQREVLLLQNEIRKLTQLRYLYLSTRSLDNIFSNITEPVIACKNFIESVCSLANIEHLDISDNMVVQTLPESICTMRKLHTLDLSGTKLTCLPSNIGEMHSLTLLNVSNCYMLNKSAVQFSSKLPHFVVQPKVGEPSSNLVLLQDINLSELYISKLENVIAAEEAQRIRLNEKRKVQILGLNWTRGARRFVEDHEVLRLLVPPHNMMEFMLKGYRSRNFPSWLMGITPDNFRSLTRVDMVDITECTSLPPLGLLRNLRILSLEGMHSITKIDWYLCGGSGTRAFGQLEEFTLSHMERLEEWHTANSCSENGNSKFMFPKLKKLQIHHCPKLRLTPCPPKARHIEIEGSDDTLSLWPRARASSPPVPVNKLTVKSSKLPLYRWSLLHQLTPLSCLVIESCSDLSSSPEITGALSSIQALILKGNDNPDMPNWMGELRVLHSLHISSVHPELKASFEVLSKLTSLRFLTLSNCENMASLPVWLGDLTSVRELKIESCPNLNNLHGTIGQLSSLQSLQVTFCDNIEELTESFSSLTSLKKLVVSSCWSIKYLPESIQGLTNLDDLQVFECPELNAWCKSEDTKAKFPNIRFRPGFRRSCAQPVSDPYPDQLPLSTSSIYAIMLLAFLRRLRGLMAAAIRLWRRINRNG